MYMFLERLFLHWNGHQVLIEVNIKAGLSYNINVIVDYFKESPTLISTSYRWVLPASSEKD